MVVVATRDLQMTSYDADHRARIAPAISARAL